jgi:hypothetical protein
MTEGAVDSLLGGLGQRATYVGLLPAATLVALIAALLAAGAPSEAPDPGLLYDRTSELSVVQAALIAVALVVATVVLHPLQLPLVQVFEGYRTPRPLAEWGRARQRRRRAALGSESRDGGPSAAHRNDDSAATADPAATEPAAATDLAVPTTESLLVAWRRGRRYPRADRVLPTTLGNAMRAGEERAGAPYGLDAVSAWPRLHPLLAEPVRAAADDRRLQLDVAVRFCATFAAAAVVTAALLWSHGWWLSVAAGCLVLCAVSYYAAVAAAVAYGDSLASAFDLHHLDLLDALQLPRPSSLAEERQLAGVATLVMTRLLPEGRSIAYAGADESTGLGPHEQMGLSRRPDRSEHTKVS